MELQEVDIYIDKDGRVRLEVRGVKGEACLDLTRPLEEALGGQIETREMTPEAEERQENVEQKRVKRGIGDRGKDG